MKRTMLLVCTLFLALLVPAAAQSQFSLVTPEWVAAHVNDADLRILDVRPDPHSYFAGHVPNAVHFADNTVRGVQVGIPVQYLPPATLALLFERAGVRPNDRVVVYSDDTSVLGATMVAYTLLKLRQPQVMLMNGGWSAYLAGKHPTTQAYPRYQTGRLPATEDRSLYVTLDEVRALMDRPGVVLVDARPQPAYAGEVNTWMRNGHIPGAINIDWHQLMDANNMHQFKTREEMQAVFDRAGVRRTDDIILYCGTSREASLEFMVLRQILGYPKVRLYEGSWTEYCAHPELPVVRGAAPR